MAEENNKKGGSSDKAGGKSETMPPTALALIAIIIGVVAVAIFLLRGQLMKTNNALTKPKSQENIRWGVDLEEGNNMPYRPQEEESNEPTISPDDVRVSGDTGSN